MLFLSCCYITLRIERPVGTKPDYEIFLCLTRLASLYGQMHFYGLIAGRFQSPSGCIEFLLKVGLRKLNFKGIISPIKFRGSLHYIFFTLNLHQLIFRIICFFWSILCADYGP